MAAQLEADDAAVAMRRRVVELEALGGGIRAKELPDRSRGDVDGFGGIISGAVSEAPS